MLSARTTERTAGLSRRSVLGVRMQFQCQTCIKAAYLVQLCRAKKHVNRTLQRRWQSSCHMLTIAACIFRAIWPGKAGPGPCTSSACAFESVSQFDTVVTVICVRGPDMWLLKQSHTTGPVPHAPRTFATTRILMIMS